MALNTTTAEADAILHDILYDTDLGNVQIIRKWIKMDATVVKALSEALTATATVIGPYIDGVKYEGTFYAHIIRDEGLPDRSVTIYQSLTKSGTNELVAITDIDASHQSTSTFKWNISLAEVLVFKAGYATSEAGIRRQFRVTHENRSGTFDVVGIEILAIEQTVTEFDASIETGETTTEEAVLNTTDDTQLPITVEVGKSKTRRLTRNTDDTSDITRREATPANLTAKNYRENAAESAESELYTQAASPLAAPIQEDGKVKRNTNTPTSVGQYETREEVAEVNDQTEISYEDNAAQTGATTLHTQADSALITPVHEDGKIKRNTNTPTEAGKTRTTEEEIDVIDQTEDSYEETAAESVESTLHTQADSALVAPVQEDGKVKRNTNAPTEAGKTRTTEEVREVNDQTETSRTDNAAESSTSILHTQADSPLGAPTAAAGELKSNTNVPTEAGKTRTTEETRTVKNQSSISYAKNGDEESTTELNTEADAPIAEPADPSAGTIVSVGNTPTPAGKTRTTEGTRAAQKQETSESYTTRYGTAYIARGTNVTEAEFQTAKTTASLTSSTNNHIAKSTNPFQLLNYTIVKRPVKGTYSSQDYTKTGFVRKETQWGVFDTVRYKRTVTITYNIRWTNNEVTAYNYIDGGEDGSFVASGGYRDFKGVRVVAPISYGAWTAVTLPP